jgi:hypothetical protein
MKRILAVAAAGGILALAGCGSSGYTGAQPIQPPASSAAPAPSPVSTAASLTSNCVMGYASMQSQSNNTIGYSGFTAGPPQGANLPAASEQPGTNYYAPDMAFQVTLTNNGTVTANVDEIAVAFYAGGTEQGSTTAGATGFITPGQSLTWTVRDPLATDGTGTGDRGDQADGTIPASATSCSLVQWDHP